MFAGYCRGFNAEPAVAKRMRTLDEIVEGLDQLAYFHERDEILNDK